MFVIMLVWLLMMTLMSLLGVPTRWGKSRNSNKIFWKITTTKEVLSSVLLTLDDGGDSKVIIDSGAALSMIYTDLAREAKFILNVTCNENT